MNLRTPFRFALYRDYNLLKKQTFKVSCTHVNKTKTADKDDDKTTHFGFKTIKESEKTKEGEFIFKSIINNKHDNKIKHTGDSTYSYVSVYSVFENVADSYDQMNDAMSFGIHRIWKDQFILKLAPEHGCRLLDCAGGTGDITFRYLKYLQTKSNPKAIKSHVTVLDINANMLDVGQARAKRQGYTVENGYDIKWIQGDAENLPCESESYTAYTIAFGIRNVTHIDKVRNFVHCFVVKIFVLMFIHLFDFLSFQGFG